ncbi:MAG: acetyl-CoA decarbonylase/synthase complex subunit gamma [Candidatus Omnitrophica bacterium]|nr:acetyl-CoA decarbonylase/synthase complex subunit gamma [Candidatus Omnitrophota bacterium]
MALSGLEIYKLLPKTNCKECGFSTCLAFAMQLAAKKTTLDKCAHVSEEAKQALEGASQPPIKLVSIGAHDNKLEVGNETVLFRHEETFYHPTGVGFLVEDTLSEKDFKERINKVETLIFRRVGQTIAVNLVALKNSSRDTSQFLSKAKILLDVTKLNIVLISENAEALTKALEILKERRPLVYAATSQNYETFGNIAKQFNVPLAVFGNSLDELSELTQKLKNLGVEELILDVSGEDILSKLTALINIRRLALKKTFRPLGYPTIVFTRPHLVAAATPRSGGGGFTDEADAVTEALAAVTYIAKYASIVIMKNSPEWAILSVLTARQDIYSDPQKPVQVEPKIYEIGNVTKNSPVIVTTNFSITYYTVAGEVEASKIPTYIISCDCEGMSVLTAWAAEKFTPEKIADTLKTSGILKKVSHKNVIIPGYVAVMSGKLEDLSGWRVIVGPKEAAGLPSFLKNLG